MFWFRNIAFIGLSLLLSNSLYSQEICDNGIDDDGNGLIDLNDSIPCNCTAGGEINLIPNPSFEDYYAIPTVVSQIPMLKNWEVLTGTTADYHHMDGYLGTFGQGGAPYTAGSLPDGKGFVGVIDDNNWNENIGTCLIAPLKAGKEYKFSIYVGNGLSSPSTDITLFGRKSCPGLFSSVLDRDCLEGINDWKEIGSVVTSGTDNTWEQFEFTFTPTEDIYAIALGPGCDGPAPRNDPNFFNYYYFDDLSLTLSSELIVLDSGSFCNNNKELLAKISLNGTYQWYRDGVALVGETADKIELSKNGYSDGLYTIKFTDDLGGCYFEDVQLADTVGIQADFSIVSNICQNTNTTFTDLSIETNNQIISYKWEMGDGAIYSTKTGSHLYQNSGDFTVFLIIESDSGCIDTVKQPMAVLPAPEISFNASGSCFPENTSFTNQTTIDNPGVISEWYWDFGDGNTIQGVSDPVHNYAGPGLYNVELRVDASNGCSDSLELTIDYMESPIADFTTDTACQNQSVAFNNLSSVITGSISNSWWDFDDGGNSTVFSPANTFINDGVYNVNLIVESSNGCRDTITKPVDVWISPVADFIKPELVLSLNDPLNFQNLSSDYLNWMWDFGDGNFNDQDVDPSHMYNQGGYYNVTLSVSNDFCSDSITQQISLFEELISFVPNAFSPNGDGLNDILFPVNNVEQEDQFQFLVFNRWGELVFETQSGDEGWDGSFKGKIVNEGLYIWSLKFYKKNGDQRDLKGDVMLLR